MMRRGTVRKAGGVVFSVISGLTLLLVLITVSSVFPLGIMAALASWHSDPSLTAFFILLGLGIAIGFAAGFPPAIALARFALRAWPIDASGVVRRRCIVWQRRLAVTMAVFALLTIVSYSVQRILGEGLFESSSSDANRSAMLLIAGVAAWATMGAGGSGAFQLGARPSKVLRWHVFRPLLTSFLKFRRPDYYFRALEGGPARRSRGIHLSSRERGS